MFYPQEGTYVGVLNKPLGIHRYKPLYSDELLDELLQELLRYRDVSIDLGYLTKDYQLTKLAIDKLIVNMEIDYKNCYDGLELWKLTWYD